MSVCVPLGGQVCSLNTGSESKQCCSLRVCSLLCRILCLALYEKTEALALYFTARHAGVIVNPGHIVSVLGTLPFFPSGTCLKSGEKLCPCVK